MRTSTMVKNCSSVILPCWICMASMITPQLSPDRVSPSCTHDNALQADLERPERSLVQTSCYVLSQQSLGAALLAAAGYLGPVSPQPPAGLILHLLCAAVDRSCKCMHQIVEKVWHTFEHVDRQVRTRSRSQMSTGHQLTVVLGTPDPWQPETRQHPAAHQRSCPCPAVQHSFSPAGGQNKAEARRFFVKGLWLADH